MKLHCIHNNGVRSLGKHAVTAHNPVRMPTASSAFPTQCHKTTTPPKGIALLLTLKLDHENQINIYIFSNQDNNTEK